METSFQAQLVIPMATSLCFGLMLSTLLVLVLVPVFYTIYGRLFGTHAVTAEVRGGEPGHMASAPVMNAEP